MLLYPSSFVATKKLLLLGATLTTVSPVHVPPASTHVPALIVAPGGT